MLYPNITDALCITVRRGSILDDTIFALRPGFDEKKHIKVRFLGELFWVGPLVLAQHSTMNVHCQLFHPFAGEPGIDEGGPKREFFMLLLNAISNKSSLLEGSPTRRVLRHNTSAFQVPFSEHCFLP